jgi:CheY-like chemotaxis protein
MVTMMGGTLGLESAPGKGSTFFFDLPVKVQAEGERGSAGIPPDINDLPVLVVDDSATNRTVLQEMLLNWGMRVTVCIDAEHTLKGSAGSLCGKRAAKAALRVEQFAEEGDLAKARQATADLGEEVGKLQQALAKLAAPRPS